MKAPPEHARRFVDAGLYALIGALIGGRVAFVAVNWNYFQAYPGEIFAVHLGGIAWSGALVGGFSAVLLTAIITRYPLSEYLAALLPLLAALVVASWLACWLAGCAYGPPADTWWGIPSRDEWGTLALRLPVQLIGALLAMGFFWLLDVSHRRFPTASQFSSIAFLGLALQMLVLSFLRFDPQPTWQGLRMETWAAASFAALALVSLFFPFRWDKEKWEREKGSRSTSPGA
jgi:phosphatidylglycerol---prolipoprotein diacylglyceryl transferase